MKPKVLFVLPDLEAGGAQQMSVQLARHLTERGWNVGLAILFHREELFAPERLAGLEVYRLDAKSFCTKLGALGRLAHLAKRYDLVIGGMQFAATNYGYLAARISDKPFLSWMHTTFACQHLDMRDLGRALAMWVYRRCRNVVFPSQGALESLRLALGAIPKEANWQVIWNFIDLRPTASCNVPDSRVFEKPVVIGVGRLVQVKAFDRLIRIHAALRSQGLDHHLVILGEGPMRTELVAQAKGYGVRETVFLPGHVTNVAEWLSRATVFALSSRCEGFSLVLLEALSCGTPAVAMDCPAGPREILQDGHYGLLVPDGDETAMSEAIARLLCEPDLRAHYAGLSKERAKHFTAERIVPRWEELFEQLVAQQGQSNG